MDDMDYYEWEASKRRFTFPKIIKFLFKFIAGLIIVTTFAAIFGRSYLMKIPKAFTGLTWTDSVTSAYESGDLDVMLHEPSEPFDLKGYYHVSNVALSKSTDEVQLTVRYNKRSTINTLMEKYLLTERPEGEVFVYILTDDKGNSYTDYTFAADSNPLYEFRRIVFSGVELDGVETLDLHIYYAEDASVKSPMYAVFTAFDGKLSVIHHEPYGEYNKEDFYRLSAFNFSRRNNSAEFTVRFNGDNVKALLSERFEITELDGDTEYLTYLLKDENGRIYSDYTVISETEEEYEFRTLTFTGIELDSAEKLYLEVYASRELSEDSPQLIGIEMYLGVVRVDYPTYKKAGSTTLKFYDAPAYVLKPQEN